ncbi:MAG: hypothetical protein A2W76_05340 [Gammaproteobacteria bacterium RIFCSPLOWO2_12_47_11]|nr:MAG: hypothetical protein A2W76_05340 [Gammaproteobacteria bacterium RIFCSPLOWO2_12_47_11]
MHNKITEEKSCDLSVIIVSDYGNSAERSWTDERNILQALALQDIGQPFEVLLVENETMRDKVPSDLSGIVPDLKMIFFNSNRSSVHINHAVSRTSGKLVALMEADCIPDPGWLRKLVNTMNNNPEISVVSGRTSYGDNTFLERCLSLLHRGFNDLGYSGLTCHISNNGALYRREVLEQFPYPETITPFLSSWMRKNLMQKNGHHLYFERSAEMIHAFEGWRFVLDLHRNRGYAAMMIDGQSAVSKIPVLLARSLITEFSSLYRLGKKYLNYYDIVPTLVLLFILPFLEIPGMLDAIKARDHIPGTDYR